MIRAFRYPLHPTTAQEATLSSWLRACCALYNGALQERRDAWARCGKSITFNDQARSLTEIRREDPAWAAIPVEVARSALHRLDRAMKTFFARVKRRETPGFPRFRSSRRYDSFTYPVKIVASLVTGSGRSARIRLPKLNTVKINLYRPLKGTPIEVHIRREADRWYAVVVCDVGQAPSPSAIESLAADRVVGVDVGLSSLAALSTGQIVANPRFAAKAARVLANRQRTIARKKKGSASRRRALTLVRRAYAHVAAQRLDHARKLAVDLLNRFDAICFEDLRIRNMVHGTLAGSIHDAGWRTLINAVACKAESAGKRIAMIDPRGTSQECSNCDNVVAKSLGVRVHRCSSCGLVLDRDVNAARNIQQRGLRALGVSAEAYEPTKALMAQSLGLSDCAQA